MATTNAALFIVILIVLQVFLVLLMIPPIQRVFVALLAFVIYPDNWNREGLYDHYLMAFKPKEWERIVKEIKR